MDNYRQLHQHFARINDLRHVQAISGWDEAAMMPVGGGPARAQALATLEVIIHGMITDPRVGDWLAAAQAETLDGWQSANVREIERVYRDWTCIPPDLVEAQKKATSASEQAWRRYRAENNWAAMAPLLEEVVNLSREEAAVRAAAGELSGYDALLDTYEPGVTSAQLDTVFADLEAFLPTFIERVLDRQESEALLPLTGHFAVERQRDLGLAVMTTLGFNFDHGRLDVSHHPFCGGVPEDVRITTRYRSDSFVSALVAVIHETGHALYEQGLPSAWRNQPVGQALSAGMHESQSLLMEMQACRTRQFLHYLAPKVQRVFGGDPDGDPAWSETNLYRLCTRVSRGYIRVDADEATYPLHVILRYRIERDLVEGKMAVDDIPDAWDQAMQRYLSLSTRGNFSDGCLQDVHWPAGLFGYFPTYTLGALTAAQLFATARRELPGLLEGIAAGNFEPLLGWLRDKVHERGRFLPYNALMQAVTGSELETGYFKAHLQARYLDGA
jgi:carboxypeptidase Taq